MKYRLIAAILLIAILGGLAFVTNETQPNTQPQPAQPSSDDAALKNFNLN